MKKVTFLHKGTGVGEDGSRDIEVSPMSGFFVDFSGKVRNISLHALQTFFRLLPAAAVAAGTEKELITLGTGAEVIARSTKGGINVKTQAAGPADNDNAMLIGIATTASQVPLTAASKPKFSTRISLTQILEIVFGAGLDENITSPIGSATAGDGAQLLFDPTNEQATGVATYATNWILAQKVAGVDTYQDSGVPVNAGQFYELAVEYGADLKPRYYIDGNLVGTGVAGTSGGNVHPVIGIQVAGIGAQKDFDCQHVTVERSLG
jgi:hypothetical protein